MSFLCPECGYKDSEVKIVGEISKKGKKIILKATGPEDVDRDIFKSDTSILKIPELGLEIDSGSLGSFYSTVEGLMDKILESLKESNVFVGDSADPLTK